MKKILHVLVLLSFVLSIGFLGNVYSANITDYDTVNLSAETYNYNPAPAIAGEEFELWIQLTNNGNYTAENVEYLLELDHPFILLDKTNIRTIDKLSGHQSKIIKYKLKTNTSALKKTYELKFKFKNGERDIYNIKTLEIDVKGDQAIVDIISSNIENAYIGSDSSVSLTIKNLGEKKAKDIFITLNDSEEELVKVLDLKTQYVDELEINETRQIDYKINVSKEAENNSYTLPISIDYSDEDSNYKTNRKIGVKILDNPNISVNVLNIGENGKIKLDQENTLSLEVYNTGNVDAESVYVTVSSPTKEVENMFSNYFIGSIEKDNYDNVDFKFTPKQKITEPLIVTVYYKDSNLKEQTVSEKITVETSENTNGAAGQSAIITILSIIGLIVGLSLLIIILKWLTKILIKPAINIIKNLFKRKK